VGEGGARRAAQVEDEALVGLAEPVAVDRHRDGLAGLAGGERQRPGSGLVIAGGAGGAAVGRGVADRRAPAGTGPGDPQSGPPPPCPSVTVTSLTEKPAGWAPGTSTCTSSTYQPS